MHMCKGLIFLQQKPVDNVIEFYTFLVNNLLWKPKKRKVFVRFPHKLSIFLKYIESIRSLWEHFVRIRSSWQCVDYKVTALMAWNIFHVCEKSSYCYFCNVHVLLSYSENGNGNKWPLIML